LFRGRLERKNGREKEKNEELTYFYSLKKKEG